MLNLIASSKYLPLWKLPSSQFPGIRMWITWGVIIQHTIMSFQNIISISTLFYLLILCKPKIPLVSPGKISWLVSNYHDILFQCISHLVITIGLIKEKYVHIFIFKEKQLSIAFSMNFTVFNVALHNWIPIQNLIFHLILLLTSSLHNI